MNEQIIVSVASLILLVIGLLQAYQKSLETGNVKEDDLRDKIYSEKVKYLHLKEKYDIVVYKYKNLKESYNDLLEKHKQLILYVRNMKDKKKHG